MDSRVWRKRWLLNVCGFGRRVVKSVDASEVVVVEVFVGC